MAIVARHEIFDQNKITNGHKKFFAHLCRRTISIKLQSNFIEITLRHGCSTVNLRTHLDGCS